MAGCVSDIVAFYNEIDPAAAAWLRWLIDHGHIAPGVVDTRSITEIQPHDLDGFTQVHFFAGIGGWSHAARLAGWPDDRPLWTGSCPCQPFSVAGKGAGSADARHLWPDFHRLISARRPTVVMGEQVAGAAGYGWFDGVAADLASENYASRYVDIPSCAVDAPHIRQRGYWIAVDVGDAIGARLEGQRRHGDTGRRPNEARPVATANGTFWSDADWLTCHDGKARRAQPGISMLVDGLPGRVAAWRGFGNAINPVLAAEVIAAFLDVGDDH
jgi:DNA (cytosine-5)-methyltransferase 1